MSSALTCCWLLTGSAGWAQTTPTASAYNFEGQSFQLKETRVDGKLAYSLDDPELKRLIALTSTQVQWSGNGESLYVFTSGRQTSWSDGCETYTLNSVECPAPGKYFARNHALEPAALWHALGLAPVAHGSAVDLDPVVTRVDASTDGSGVQFKMSAPIKFQADTVNPGHLTCVVEGGGWDLPSRSMQIGDVSIKVRGGTSAQDPLALEMFYPPMWKGRVHRSLTGDLELSEDLAPGQASNGKGTANVNDISWIAAPAGAPAADRSLQVSLSQPVTYSWCYAPESQILTVTLGNAQAPSTLQFPGLAQAPCESTPVVRYQVKLAANQTFAIDEGKPEDPKLTIRFSTAVGAQPVLQGLADMPGSAPARGLIVLDPGHGGGDPGCYGRSVGAYEKDITLDICRRLQQLLTSRGWQVVMTRQVDRDVTWAHSPDAMELQARSDVANNRNADLFVSIHCNASVSSGPHGSAVYYYKPEDYDLAQSLNVLGEACGFSNNGVLRNNYHVLRCTSMPAVLVETAFLTNPYDAPRLADPNVRQSIAERLAGGIDHYYDGHVAQSHRPAVARVRPIPVVAQPAAASGGDAGGARAAEGP